MGNYCGKFLQEIVAIKACRTRRRGKGQFKKDSDWWKFNIWNRVMGSQQSGYSSAKSCRKIMWGNLAGNCCGKILQENLAGNYCGKFLWEIVGGKSCGKILRENLVGQGEGKKGYLRKVVIGGNLAFRIG